MKTAREIYEAQTGDKCPSNQIAYSEWHQRYVKWLEENTERKTDWVENTKENCPNKSGLVLVNCQRNGEECTLDDMFIAYYRPDKGFEVWGAGREPNNDFPVTHWKHLPNPPHS